MEFAIVKAGHDSRQIYQICKEDDNFVYLINGKTRTSENPRKKSKKHIQIIKNLPDEVHTIMEQNVEENHKVSKAIKCLNQHIYK